MTDTTGRSGAQRTTYEVLAVRYGTLESSRRHFFQNFELYGEPDAAIRMDYFFWIVRTGERTVVIDTGFDPDTGRRRGRDVVCEPADALSRLGVSPDTVSHVVLTHFHYDHIGNVSLFPNAQFILSPRELDFWSGPYASRPLFAAAVEENEVRYLVQAAREGRVQLAAGDASEIPGLHIFEIAGHTPGQLAVSVPTATGDVVLASDAAHLYEEFQDDRPFSIFSDLEGMYRGFEVLRNLESSPNVVVVPGHDPAVMDRFPPVEGPAGDIAVRIA